MIADFLAKLEKEPVDGLGDRVLTQTLATTGIASTLLQGDLATTGAGAGRGRRR
ncbi:hypothetical protein SMICM304S_06468 [Streptomyces microflavus]